MTTLAEPAAGAVNGAHTPPHNTEAEQVVLGAMMMSRDAIDAVTDRLNTADFYRTPVHGDIFDVILDLYGRGEPFDMVAVGAALGPKLARYGGAPYLYSCVASVPTAANAGYYAGIVADLATRRRLIEGATKVLQMGYESTMDAPELVDAASQIMYDLSEARGSGDGFESLADLLNLTLSEIESAGDGTVNAIPTGFSDLDRLLNGLAAGQLIVVAGRPGQGKSTAGLDMIRNAAIRHNIPGAVFSLEMSKVEVVTRLLSAEARIPMNVLRTGELSLDDWTKLARRMGEINDAPIFVDDTPNMTLMHIRAKARRLKQRYNLKLIVVDYLQLMSSPPTKGFRPQHEEIAELSRGLKLLAKEVECAVVAISQLNRGPEQRTDKVPTLSDLRGSGAIEQDADVVIFVHRDDYYDKESPRAGEADFIVAKHRNGPTDTVSVAAQLHMSRFVDMAVSG